MHDLGELSGDGARFGCSCLCYPRSRSGAYYQAEILAPNAATCRNEHLSSVKLPAIRTGMSCLRRGHCSGSQSIVTAVLDSNKPHNMNFMMRKANFSSFETEEEDGNCIARSDEQDGKRRYSRHAAINSSSWQGRSSKRHLGIQIGS